MPGGAPSRWERLAFAAFSAAVLAYVVLRAVLVPVVHDEAMTFFVYVETGDFLPFRAHWDAGNHLLCTALGWLSWSVFGMHAWALRLPSVLAFGLYACYGWRWGLKLHAPPVRRCFWAAWLLMPFLLDFFALFRGYGLAMAFWAMALYELCALLAGRSTRKLVLALLAMAGAGFSSLNLLTAWAAVLAITAWAVLRKPVRRGPLAARALLWLLLGAGPFLYAAAYAHGLSLRGTLYYGLQNGILLGTLPSLLKVVLGHAGPAAIAGTALIALGGTAAAWRAWRARERGFPAWALAVFAGLLWAEVAAREFLFHWNGTPFPEDRTALHALPLLLLLFAFALDRQAGRAPRWKWLALLLLIFPLRTIATANLRTTMYWPEQAIPSSIFQAAEREHQGAGRPLTIGAYHQMPACWGFGLRERDLALNAVDVSGFPHGGEDLLLVDPQRDTVPGGYREVERTATGHLALYARESPRPAMRLLLDSVIPALDNDAEFRELWHPAVEAVRGRSFFVALDLSISPGREPMTGELAVVTDAPGPGQHNDHVLLQFMRDPPRSGGVHAVRHIPAVPQDATRTVIFLWNPARLGYASSGRMRIYLVDEKNPHAHP